MLIYESMRSLLVSYDYIGSYITKNMVAKTGTSTLHGLIFFDESLKELTFNRKQKFNNSMRMHG